MSSHSRRDEPTISIVIVNYNGHQWLDKCITSLQKQTYFNIEIIVVDNRSSDDSVDIIRGFRDVKLVESSSNLGFANGVNSGIDQAIGSYILLFNTDAWVEKNFVEKLMNELIERKLDVIAPNENDYNDTAREKFSTTLDLIGYPVRRRANKPSLYLQGVCMLFSKDLYLETGGLDNDFFMYFEETDWCWRLRLYGKKIAYSNDLFIHHAGSGTTGKGVNYNAFLWRNQNCLQMLLKNSSLPLLVIQTPLYFLQNIIDMIGLILLGKPSIAWTYVRGLAYNIKLLPRTIEKRRRIRNRKTTRFGAIESLFYWGSGRLSHIARKSA